MAEAKLSGHHEIEIWGEGRQTRSFTYIDDCVEGTVRLTDSEIGEPLNVGSSELVTINQLIGCCGTDRRDRGRAPVRPQRPAGRPLANSDKTLIPRHARLGTAHLPGRGLKPTYRWIYEQLAVRVHA